MSQQQSKQCPILKNPQPFLDIGPNTTLEELHDHYKNTLLEEFKKNEQYELKSFPADNLYLWFKRHGGDTKFMSTTYLMYGGLNFCCPDEFLTDNRFKTVTRHQPAEIIVMALEKQL